MEVGNAVSEVFPWRDSSSFRRRWTVSLMIHGV